LLSFGFASSPYVACPVSLEYVDHERGDQKQPRAGGRGHRDQGEFPNELLPQHS
jgi:hypothetical protein